MKSGYSVLFSILYYGETEFSSCIESIYKNITYENKIINCFQYKSSLEAHRLCYENFLTSDYDILVKVDADMIFNKDITKYLNIFYNSEKNKHMTFLIYDFITKTDIPALHVYKKNFSFIRTSKEKLDVFNSPIDYKVKELGIISHNNNLDPFQIFRTGFFRARRLHITNSETLYKYLNDNNLSDNYWLREGYFAYINCREKIDNVNYNNSLIFKYFIIAMEKQYA